MTSSLRGLPRPTFRFLPALTLLIGLFAASTGLARPVGDAAPRETLAYVEAGDTLERLLRELGFEGEVRREIILGISAEFDPRRLRPGHSLGVVWSSSFAGRANAVVLTIDDGERIELDLSDAYPAVRREPETERRERAVRVSVADTLFAALESVGAPSRLAVDLAGALAGLVDFRRDLRGGETVELLYEEDVRPDGERVGAPELRFARLRLGGRTIEVAGPGGDDKAAQIFENGEAIPMAAAPVVGARVSSVFGRRVHPVYGTLRMHTGVDFAAARGTPVFASAPGTVSFVGQRRGYGRVVEIRHGTEVMTRYAHLSGYAAGLKTGQRLDAGQRIGAVGASGTATGPNLHYEVRFDGRAVDPLSEEQLAALGAPAAAEADGTVLEPLREALVRRLRAQLRSRAEGDRPSPHSRT